MGTLLGISLSLFLAVLGLVWYPIKHLFIRLRAKKLNNNQQKDVEKK